MLSSWHFSGPPGTKEHHGTCCRGKTLRSGVLSIKKRGVSTARLALLGCEGGNGKRKEEQLEMKSGQEDRVTRKRGPRTTFTVCLHIEGNIDGKTGLRETNAESEMPRECFCLV